MPGRLSPDYTIIEKMVVKPLVSVLISVPTTKY